MRNHRLYPLVLAILLATGARAVDPNPKAMGFFRKALEENKAGNFGAALKLYIDAHREDPEILALDEQGLMDNATGWLGEQLDADDNDLHAHFQMAELQLLQGSQRQALGHYEKVVQLDPTSPLAKLAGPLIKDLQARLPAAGSAPAGGGGGGGGGGSACSDLQGQVDELQRQVLDLQSQLDRSQDELRRLRDDSQSSSNDDAAALAQLRKDYQELQQKAERWRRIRNKYRRKSRGC